MDPELLDDCVHCGFCLPTCPTYVGGGVALDSPRGRIQLMQQAVEGEVITDAMVGHWDACLGCMACVTACPSGVQYDRLIEDTRAEVERVHKRSTSDRALRRLIFAIFPHPKRLRLLRGPLRGMQRTGLDRALLVHRSRLTPAHDRDPDIRAADLIDGGDLDQPSARDDGCPVAQLCGLVQVVRREQNRRTLALE